jgi:superfamily II RNA helicase
MRRKFKYPRRHRSSNRKDRPPHKKSSVRRIKPGADAKLKKVFASIGVPGQTSFKPDPFQVKAVKTIQASDCLVTAPTGAGKTWIAEQAIAQMLKSGRRAWYASPLKALSNAKFTDFCRIFGNDRVGILTGDRKENTNADLIVGTTEILRNHLYDAMHRGESIQTDLVVLDEAHFLGDQDRGVVWEEIMIYLPNRIPLLLLSATVGNALQIADWLSGIRTRKCKVVTENHRPVPLYPLFLHPNGTLFPMVNRSGKSNKNRLYKKVREFAHMRRPPLISKPGRLPPFGDILQVLRKYRLLPAIFFLKSRADCDKALTLCLDSPPLNQARLEGLNQRIDQLLSERLHTVKHRQRPFLEQQAIGAHHSGQLPAWKLILETLMSEGLLDAVFATSTVAAGVNFPARTVVFLNTDRFNGAEFLPLTATEFHQMTGRAGRRGMDRIGFALAVPGKYLDIRLAARLLNAPSSDIFSQIRINFSMALNLLLSHTPSQIEKLLEKSFASYQLMRTRKPRKHGSQYLWKDFERHLRFLKKNGFVRDDDTLTEEGRWASRLRVDQPLLIAEAFRRGALPVKDPVLMAATVSCFVFERETDDRIEKALVPKTLRSAYTKLKNELAPFAHRMIDSGFIARPLYLRPAAAVFSWAGGHPWEKSNAIAEMEEGLFSSLILRTVDNLRHIKGLRNIFPEAGESAATAIELVLRDPVMGW